MAEELSGAGKYAHIFERLGIGISYAAMLVGSVVVLLLVLDLAIGASVSAYDRWRDPGRGTETGDSRERLPPFRAATGARKFAREHYGRHFEPYYHWRRDVLASDYVNVDDNGVRRTVKAPVADSKKVFVFGGSGAWGVGVADAYTIASRLQARLDSRYDVYNYGEIGFVSAQELTLLLKELAFGNIPDVVIFYNGANDGYAGAYSPALPRDPLDERRRNQMKSEVDEFIGRSNMYRLLVRLHFRGNITDWDKAVAPKIAANAKTTLDVYEQFIAQARAIAAAYRFKVYFFWQPNLLTATREMQPYERSIAARSTPTLTRAMQEVYREAKARLSGRDANGVFFLGNILDNVSEPCYIDWIHLGPDANDIVAEQIFRRVQEKF